jgi:hypothetical protein
MHYHVDSFYAVVAVRETPRLRAFPQMTISGLPEFFASITFQQMAAGAFSRPPSRVPYGP